MRFECAYSQGNPIKTQPVAAVLVKTVENRKKQAAPYVPQIAVIWRSRRLKKFLGETVQVLIHCPANLTTDDRHHRLARERYLRNNICTVEGTSRGHANI
jgi:hypothetical protein